MLPRDPLLAPIVTHLMLFLVKLVCLLLFYDSSFTTHGDDGAEEEAVFFLFNCLLVFGRDGLPSVLSQS